MNTNKPNGVTAVFSEKLPLSKLLPLGLQHLVTMVGSFMVPVLVGSAMGLDSKTLAYLVSAIFFTSGVAILIQVIGIGKGIGSKLPLFMGSSFITLGPMIVIGKQYGLPTLFGSIIASGIIIFLLSFFFDKLLIFFPKIVTGTFITIMGISLAPTAFKDFAGGESSPVHGSSANMLIGTIVIALIILLHKFCKGFLKTMAILIGVLIGTILAGIFGMIDFNPVADANWLQVVTPFHFGLPEFHLNAIMTMSIFCLINLIQCIGSYSVLDETCGTETTDKDTIRGLRGQAVGQVISGMFNSVPHAFLNENIGVMSLSGFKNRFITITTGCILIVLSFFPKFSAFITVIPSCVRGGAMLAIFGMVISAGISILSRVDFSGNHNTLIIGTSIAIGVGSNFDPGVFNHMPWLMKTLFENGMFSACLCAVVLNVCLNFHTFKGFFSIRPRNSEAEPNAAWGAVNPQEK
ncbi:nucleobase:cation symporter-2 family protein [Scopulibacillus cellulosilyticus]|uniref:Nucleobase:cation symporter-2 family protein n=1 Tax=Scopulibacillus cellulosilyticus TaxID=2665665 RepID=A0ABW2Q6V9_9BACL